MHDTSHDLMKDLFEKHCPVRQGLKVLDVGALDINGSYRDIFEPDNEYTGMDLVEGKNVDITSWLDVDQQCYDLCVSGQTLEHAENPQQPINAMATSLKPNGSIILIASSPQQRAHAKLHYKDYWRFLPDGMALLLTWAGCEVLEVGSKGRDTWGVGRKP
jgi:SAM-dependent methyltransferase